MSQDAPRPSRHRTLKPELSAREVRFCALYVETGNLTRSYIDAGFPHKSENAAAQGGRYLLRNSQIREFCRKLQADAAEAAKVTPERIAREWAKIAFADRRDLYHADGRLKLPHEWPDDVAAVVAGVETEEIFELLEGDDGKRRRKYVGDKVKVKFERKTEALKNLALWRRMLGDDRVDASAAPAPLVVGGEADPNSL